MKLFFLLLPVFFLTISPDGCHKKSKNNTEATVPADKNAANNKNVYKGRLEVKGICMNYTIGLLQGKIDTSVICASWTNNATNKTYNNVFRLGSPCSFPASIQQGDEFYFTIDSAIVQNCMVCMAYYPTPPKKLSIKVVEKK